MRIDDRVRARARSQPDESQPFLAHPAGFWMFLMGPVPPRLAWLASARRNTDAEPWLEILGPRAHADGQVAAFARGPLADILAEVSAQPLPGTPLAALDPERLRWRSAGMALGRATLTPGPEGAAGALALLRGLPPELRRSLEVDAP